MADQPMSGGDYLLRPPLALERLTETAGGQRLDQLRRPGSDRSTPLLLEPLELRSIARSFNGPSCPDRP